MPSTRLVVCRGHTFAECYNGLSAIKHANAFQGYQPPPQHPSHLTAYNQGGKSYSNPLYTNPIPPPQNAMRPPGFQPRVAYTPPPPPSPQPSTAHLESMMTQFLAAQTKANEAMIASINQLTSKFDAMTTHQKTMDTQIAQIAQQVSHLSRPQAHLSGQPGTNPSLTMDIAFT